MMVFRATGRLNGYIVNVAAVKWSYGCEMPDRQFRGSGGKRILSSSRRDAASFLDAPRRALLAGDLRKLRFLLGRARFPKIFGKRS
jgi:hypothetical protein